MLGTGEDILQEYQKQNVQEEGLGGLRRIRGKSGFGFKMYERFLEGFSQVWEES